MTFLKLAGYPAFFFSAFLNTFHHDECKIHFFLCSKYLGPEYTSLEYLNCAQNNGVDSMNSVLHNYTFQRKLDAVHQFFLVLFRHWFSRLPFILLLLIKAMLFQCFIFAYFFQRKKSIKPRHILEKHTNSYSLYSLISWYDRFRVTELNS